MLGAVGMLLEPEQLGLERERILGAPGQAVEPAELARRRQRVGVLRAVDLAA